MARDSNIVVFNPSAYDSPGLKSQQHPVDIQRNVLSNDALL